MRDIPDVPCLWKTRVEGEVDLCPQGSVICEIGVLRGGHAKYLWSELNPSKLVLIDFWTPLDPSNPKRVRIRNLQYEGVKDRFKDQIATDRVEVIKGKSGDVASRFEDNYFDMVVVDGDHHRDGVFIDIDAYYPKLKSGGLFSCHDYNRDPASLAKGFDVPGYLHDAIERYDDLECIGRSDERVGRNLMVRKK